jgi:hypothetical protein
MVEKFIAIYVLIDDIMIEIGHKEPVNHNSFDSGLIAVDGIRVELPEALSVSAHINDLNIFQLLILY